MSNSTKDVQPSDPIVVHFDGTTTVSGTFTRISPRTNLLVIDVGGVSHQIKDYWYFTYTKA